MDAPISRIILTVVIAAGLAGLLALALPHTAPALAGRIYLPVISRNCWPSGVPAGALPGQPGPVFCSITGNGPGTAQKGDNAWVDEFDHNLSFARMDTSNYRVYDGIGSINQSIHWRHANHWMVDIGPRTVDQPSGWGQGGAMIRPDRSFRFQDGKLVVETVVAAGIDDYDGDAWVEITISNGDRPEGVPREGPYSYDLFPSNWTLGCRLHDSRVSICALKDDSGDMSTYTPSVRIWEMSGFQRIGTYVYGGDPLNGRGNFWRLCVGSDPDMMCRDRFRLELTRTSLTLYVNGIKYFEQTGIPPLPDELVAGEVYVYLVSMVSAHTAETVRYHWDRVAVNPDLLAAPVPGQNR